MTALTKGQAGTLKFIKSFMKRNGMPPTRMDICKHFGFSSPNAAEDYLRELAKKKAIKLIPSISRGIKL